MAPGDWVVVLLASLLVGGLGIYAGARLLAGDADYGRAVVTAALGALAWVAAERLFGGFPLVGPALVILAYLAVIKWRYRVGWLTAAGVAFVAWIAALVVLAVLAELGYAEFGAVGVPWV